MNRNNKNSSSNDILKDVINESVNNDGIEGLVRVLKGIYSMNRKNVEISYVGSELIIDVLENEIIEMYQEIKEILENKNDYPISDVFEANKVLNILKNTDLERLKAQTIEERNLFKNAKVSKVTSLIGGEFVSSVDFNTLTSISNEIRFNVNQAIAFLNHIASVFEEVKKENSGFNTIITGKRSVINGDNIIELAIPLFEDRIIEKIAKSENQEIINKFHEALDNLLYPQRRNSLKLNGFDLNIGLNFERTNLFDDNGLQTFKVRDFIEKKKLAFILFLPLKNKIRFEYEKLKIEGEIYRLKTSLNNIISKKMYESELQTLENKMGGIKEWQVFRSRETKENQIKEQQTKIDKLVSTGEAERKKEILRIEEQMLIKRSELNILINK